MDKLYTQLSYYCPKHPDYQIEFLQVDSLSTNQRGQKLFYCSNCAFLDPNFKLSNYTLFKNIIKSGKNEILQNWPPLSDNQLIKQLIEILRGKEDNESILAEIEQYFKDLKNEIIKQIDICQKKMIQQAQMITENKTEILNRYQALSRVNELSSVLMDNQTDIHAKEEKYREFLENIIAKTQTITQELSTLLDYHKNESAIEMKQSIMNSICQINFFQQNNIQTQNRSINPNQQQQQKLDVQLFTTDLDNGKDFTNISKNQNNQYQVQVQRYSKKKLNTVSNITLQNEPKYVFRLQIKMIKENDSCRIGLMQSSNIHIKSGGFDYLSCDLLQKDNCIRQYTKNNHGINKLIKGSEFILSKENEIELRVCIKDQILEVLDYPNYTCKLVLEDEYKSKLINHKDLRLYLGIYTLNSSMILKEAFTVSTFQ